MGLFWDLMQQSQLSQQESATDSLEERVASLERQLADTRRVQSRLLEVLENHFGSDIDGDGVVG